jgi:hypothetical protein
VIFWSDHFESLFILILGALPLPTGRSWQDRQPVLRGPPEPRR